MPYRKFILAEGEIYHVFNRGIDRMNIFRSENSHRRFIELIEYYRYRNVPVSFSNFKKLGMEERSKIMQGLQDKKELNVEIYVFCLMNNHFHFLLKQVTDKGIAAFISKIQNAYAKYFNIKTDRSGPLFQPMFKSVRVESDEQLLHVSRYIHLNPTTSYLVSPEKLESYLWSSLGDYIEVSENFNFIEKRPILELIKKEKYKQFIYDQVNYQRELKKIRDLIIE